MFSKKDSSKVSKFKVVKSFSLVALFTTITMLSSCNIFTNATLSSYKPENEFSYKQQSLTLDKTSNFTFNADWMTQMESTLASKKLRELVLPGSHDSCTYNISENSDFAKDNALDSILANIESTKELFNKIFKKDKKDSKLKKFIAPWSKAQSLTTYQQLLAGIRYLDLRVYRKSSGEMMIVHGMYSDSIDNVLNDVKRFTLEYPKEILILDFNHLYNMKNNHELLVKKLNEALPNKMIPNSFTPNSTVSEIWSKNKQVITLYDDSETVGKHSELWSQNTIFSPWANKQNINDLKDSLQQILDGKPFNNTKNSFECNKAKDNCQSISKDKFFVLQGIITPNTDTIGKNLFLFLNYENTKENLAELKVDLDKTTKKLDQVRTRYNSLPFYLRPFYYLDLMSWENKKKATEKSLSETERNFIKIKEKYESTPNSLLSFAEITTPTIKYLIKNDWAKKDLNIIITDWFQITDIVEVIKELNRTR